MTNPSAASAIHPSAASGPATLRSVTRPLRPSTASCREPTRTLIPPRKILTRQSTDVTAVDDPLVAHTLNHELIRQRLKVAQLLLRETQLPLLDIAERAGFQHQEYLGAVFKEHFNLTPAQYRHSGGD